jgi:hypothetical protein
LSVRRRHISTNRRASAPMTATITSTNYKLVILGRHCHLPLRPATRTNHSPASHWSPGGITWFTNSPDRSKDMASCRRPGLGRRHARHAELPHQTHSAPAELGPSKPGFCLAVGAPMSAREQGLDRHHLVTPIARPEPRSFEASALRIRRAALGRGRQGGVPEGAVPPLAGSALQRRLISTGPGQAHTRTRAIRGG